MLSWHVRWSFLFSSLHTFFPPSDCKYRGLVSMRRAHERARDVVDDERKKSNDEKTRNLFTKAQKRESTFHVINAAARRMNIRTHKLCKTWQKYLNFPLLLRLQNSLTNHALVVVCRPFFLVSSPRYSTTTRYNTTNSIEFGFLFQIAIFSF